MIIENLRMVCHSTETTFQYHGFTVKPGNYFGTALWNGVKAPVFWSGWTCEKCIRLYNCLTGEAVWVDENEVKSWGIIESHDWSQTEDSEVPFFVWRRWKQENDALWYLQSSGILKGEQRGGLNHDKRRGKDSV